MVTLPTNHPFLHFSSIETEESLQLSVSFKNLKVNGVSLYDLFQGKTVRQNIPLVVLDNVAVGKSVVEDTKSQVSKALVNEFLNELHEETIEDRFKVQLYYREPEDEAGRIEWGNVAYFVGQFTKNLPLVNVKAGHKDGNFIFLIEPDGNWTDETNYQVAKTHSVQIPFGVKECTVACDQVYNASDKDKIMQANDVLKILIYNQFSNWMYRAKSDTLVQIA